MSLNLERWPGVEGFKVWLVRQWDKVRNWRNGHDQTMPAAKPFFDFEPVPLVEPPRTARTRTAKPKSYADIGLEAAPLWEFKIDLLDRLDEYFACMRRIKKFDPDSYNLFSRVGLSIPGHGYMVHETVSDYARPGFGGILFGLYEEIAKPDSCWPSFIYFQKMHNPPRVQWASGDEVYAVTVVYDARKLVKAWQSDLVAPFRFHVAVNGAGETRVLKERVNRRLMITPGNSARRHRSKENEYHLSFQTWDYPDILKVMHFEEPGPHASVSDQFCWMFRCAFCTVAECQRKIVVRVQRENLTAAFGIELHRAKYFFKDRSLAALARDGKRKRIFHSCSEHPRHLKKSNRIIDIPFHYKGLRHFDWHGDRVRIVLPYKNEVLNFPGPAFDRENFQPENGTPLNMTQVGKRFDQELSQ